MRIFSLTAASFSCLFLSGATLVFIASSCSKNSNEEAGSRKGRLSVTASTSKVLETQSARSAVFECDTCVVSGMYVGTSYPNVGSPSNLIYAFHQNNLAVGHHETYEPGVSFGGYRHNCDSIIWTVNYTLSGDYYLMKGAFSSGMNTISGTFQNLNSLSDYGTFSMSK